MYSVFAIGDFCCLLMTIINSLDPDQDWQNNGPDLGTLIVFLNSEKVDFEKNQHTTKSMQNYPAKN